MRLLYKLFVFIGVVRVTNFSENIICMLPYPNSYSSIKKYKQCVFMLDEGKQVFLDFKNCAIKYYAEMLYE